MLIRRFLPALFALAVVACGDDDSPTGNTNLSGSMAFSFTGAGGGNFNVSGAAPALSANLAAGNWAAGVRDDASNSVAAYGLRARGGGRFDMMIVSIDRVTVGSATVESGCDPDTGDCSGFVFLVNISEADENFDFICSATTGTVAITSISGTRAQGTFTGSGMCFTATGAQSNFSVQNGTFDVALLTEAQLPQ